MNRYFYLFISFFIGVLTVGAQNFPEDGAIYRISNTVRDNSVLVENYMTHQLKGGTKKEGEAAQLWLFKQNGEGWNIQNVFTGRYIKIETSNSKLYTTDTEDVALDVFYVSRNNNYTTECYNIVNNKGGNYGIHCETDGDIVPWYASTSSFDGSEWTYEKVDFTAEDIAKVRENYYKFNELLSNREQIMEKYSAFFEDESCSQLKSEYTSMSDDELTAAMEGCGESLISIVSVAPSTAVRLLTGTPPILARATTPRNIRHTTTRSLLSSSTPDPSCGLPTYGICSTSVLTQELRAVRTVRTTRVL